MAGRHDSKASAGVQDGGRLLATGCWLRVAGFGLLASCRNEFFPLAAPRGRTGRSPRRGKGVHPRREAAIAGVYPSVAARHLPFARGGSGYGLLASGRNEFFPLAAPRGRTGGSPRRGKGVHPRREATIAGVYPSVAARHLPFARGGSSFGLLASGRNEFFPLAAPRGQGEVPAGGRGCTPAAKPPSPGSTPPSLRDTSPSQGEDLASGCWLRTAGFGLLASD